MPPSEATLARIRAEHDLEQRKADANRIHRVVASWRATREQNHIAEAFEISMKGRRA
jgi:hypothetical protein